MKTILSLFIALFPLIAFSVEPEVATSPRGHFVISAGAMQAHQGKAQHIDIQGLQGNDFSVTQRRDESALLGLGYYLDAKKSEYLDLSFGVHAYYLGKTSSAGYVKQEGIATNLSYDYSVVNYPIFAMVKSNFHLHSPRYAVTLDAGIGPNIMRTYNYKEVSLDNVTVPDDAFTINTTTSLAATAGLGLRIKNLLGPYTMEFGYRFFYLGSGEFETKNNQVLDQFSTGNIYAHSLIISIDFESALP